MRAEVVAGCLGRFPQLVDPSGLNISLEISRSVARKAAAVPLSINPTATGRFEISLPAQLSSYATDASLASGPYEETQPFFDHGALRASSTATHGLTHQAIVNLDVCPHTTTPDV